LLSHSRIGGSVISIYEFQFNNSDGQQRSVVETNARISRFRGFTGGRREARHGRRGAAYDTCGPEGRR
jgi:hypothetical protein